jgi:hypothetical protein
MPEGAVPLESILRTEELHRRPWRPPDYEKENRALVALAIALADSPKNAGKPRRSRRGWIGVGRAGLNAQAADIFPGHSGALNGRWSGEDGNPGIHAGEDVHRAPFCKRSPRKSWRSCRPIPLA